MAVTRTRTLQPLADRAYRIRMVTLLAALPLFASTFHYAPDAGPLYALSKLWPVLTLPLAVLGYIRLKLPARVLYVTAMAYLISVPPFMAMLYWNSSLFEALLTTVKFLPFSFYLSLSMMLAWLRPTAAELRQSITALGTLTFGLMAALWVLMPAGSYRTDYGAGTIFLGDDGVRGARIQMPMFFGLLLIFQLGRDLARSFRLIDMAKLALCYALLLIIYKERIPIAFSVMIIALALATGLMRSRLGGVLLMGFLGAGALALGVMLLGLDSVETKLGGSLSVRIDTAILAWNYISDNPLRWIVGVGSTTLYAAVQMSDLFRDPFFVLADIGWLGVIFEDGLLGVLPILAIYLVGLIITQMDARNDDDLTLALADYAVYIVASSLIYSPTYLPAEIAFVTAMAVYLLRLEGGALGRKFSVLPLNQRV